MHLHPNIVLKITPLLIFSRAGNVTCFPILMKITICQEKLAKYNNSQMQQQPWVKRTCGNFYTEHQYINVYGWIKENMRSAIVRCCCDILEYINNTGHFIEHVLQNFPLTLTFPSEQCTIFYGIMDIAKEHYNVYNLEPDRETRTPFWNFIWSFGLRGFSYVLAKEKNLLPEKITFERKKQDTGTSLIVNAPECRWEESTRIECIIHNNNCALSSTTCFPPPFFVVQLCIFLSLRTCLSVGISLEIRQRKCK